NTVGPDDDEIDFTRAHQGTSHALGNDGRADTVANQLPGRQPRPLHERARLVGKYRHFFALLDGGSNDAKRGTVAGRGERAGVAMGQDSASVGHDLGADAAHQATVGDVLVVNGARFALETVGNFVGGRASL